MATYQALSFHPFPLSTSSRDDSRPSLLPGRDRSSPFRLASPAPRKALVAFSRGTVSSILPTKKFASEKIPIWSSRAIKAFSLGQLEMKKLKYTTFGTESLLLGILVEGSSSTAKFLRANGLTAVKVQQETINILGKSDLYVKVAALKPSPTVQAQRALDWAVEEKLKSGHTGEITTAHILLGIWSEPQSAGRLALEALGFNDEKAKEVAKFMNEETAMSFKLNMPAYPGDSPIAQ